MTPAGNRFRAPGAFLALAILVCAVSAAFSPARSFPAPALNSPLAPGADSLAGIEEYISSGWDKLTRRMNECQSLADPKTDEESVLYLPADMPAPPEVAALRDRCRVRIEHLPSVITQPGGIDISKIPREGLLYLEHPYVVPGGQFNEMYGWDSYFIIRGLLRQSREELARGMVDNFLFEIEHYGGVLNANRTYYLTRSQPPFLTSMILAVYDAEKEKGKENLSWLARAYPLAVRDYEQWNEGVHQAGDTGLSRYFDRGEGPAPEIMTDPSHYYRGVANYFLIHPEARTRFLVDAANAPATGLVGPVFSVFVCDAPATGPTSPDCGEPSRVALSAGFYKGDRSLRESGFDVTFRFGPYGDQTDQFAPVCLNSLLYKTEKDLERISTLLGHADEAAKWGRKAAEREARIVKYLWNEREGRFFDYDFVTQTQSGYDYATTFYPLWAGLASRDEAGAVVRSLPLFEQPGGIVTSRTETGAQWDFPYGWAPLELLGAEGLRRYGFDSEADRISEHFLSMVVENFNRDHTIREKYNVVTRSSETRISKGYAQNVIGFGWTNGVFLELLHESPKAEAYLHEHE